MIESVPLWMTLLGFLLVLGPLVTVHEMGHYLVGRWFGVKADSFSVGFGPEMAGWTDKRGTRWKLSALPLGGYVQFAGDMNPASQPDENWHNLPEAERNQTFQSKPLWQRALIVAAGPVTNFLLALAIMIGFLLAYGQSVTPAVVDKLAPDSAAMRAGLQKGDRIISVDGRATEYFVDVQGEVMHRPKEQIALGIIRDGEKMTLPVTLDERVERDRFGNEFRIGMIGVHSVEPTIAPVSVLEAPGIAIGWTAQIVRTSIIGIGQIITGRRPVEELGGPLKIAKFSGEQFSLGWVSFVQFIALISINLGFINLLPIPMLDGGHLMFYALEAVRRRPASPRLQEWAFRSGLAVVLAMMIFVTFNDLASFGIFG